MAVLPRPDDAVKAVANEIWTVTGLELSPTYAPPLLALLSNPAEHARQAAAQAIAAAMTTHTSTASATAKQLCELFTSCVPTTKKMTEAERIEASLFEKPSSNGGSKHSVNAAVSDEAAWMAQAALLWRWRPAGDRAPSTRPAVISASCSRSFSRRG